MALFYPPVQYMAEVPIDPRYFSKTKEMICDLIANSKLISPLRQRYLNASYVKNIAIKTYKISVIFMFF